MGIVDKIFTKTFAYGTAAAGIGSLSFGAGVFSSERVEDITYDLLHQFPEVEQGYCPTDVRWEIERKANAKGNTESYIVGSNGLSLPCFEGLEGPLFGDVLYIAKTAPLDQRQTLARESYLGSSEEQREDLAMFVAKDYMGLQWTQLKRKVDNLWKEITD